KLSHQSSSNVIPMKVSPDTELRHLDFIRPENLAGTTDGVGLWMVEVLNEIDVDPEFAGEHFAIEREVLLTAIAGQPCEIPKCKRLWLSRLLGLSVGRSDGLDLRGVRLVGRHG